MSNSNQSNGKQMFANRLKKNKKHLNRWLNNSNIYAYRLYDADIPEYALALDIYQVTNSKKPFAIVQEYQALNSSDTDKAVTRLQDACNVILEFLEIDSSHLILKVRKQQKGLSQYEKQCHYGKEYSVFENNLKFVVNFEKYLDTGLFLDHRFTRQMIREMGQGKRFLNLFAYTGSATVYAVAGGAKSSTTVDMSNTYLKWAEKNIALNKLGSEAHQFIQADCIKWINQCKNKFDLIFLDPPSFSSSKRMSETFDVQRDHANLIQNTMNLLSPLGCLIFSNNRRKFKIDLSQLNQYDIQNITKKTIPKDFERRRNIHNCWRIQHPST